MSTYKDKKAILKKMGKIYDSLPNGELKEMNTKLQDLRFHQDGMKRDIRYIKKVTK